uniref:Uncharacterized protein n=1 Tax=Glossina palpalis gambiensis TaxID=67801 RepID=A0A1B0B292_9MUSC
MIKPNTAKKAITIKKLIPERSRVPQLCFLLRLEAVNDVKPERLALAAPLPLGKVCSSSSNFHKKLDEMGGNKKVSIKDHKITIVLAMLFQFITYFLANVYGHVMEKELSLLSFCAVAMPVQHVGWRSNVKYKG